MALETIYLLLFPFAVIGGWKLWEIVQEKTMVKKGYFRAYFRQQNHRKKSMYVKPIGDSIKVKDKLYPFSDNMGYIYYAGTTPEIEYSEHGEQINFHKRENTSIDAMNLNALAARTYNLGKKHASKEDKIIKIASIMAAGCSAIAVLMLYSMMQG